MKKIINLILILFVSFSLFSCDFSNINNNTGEDKDLEKIFNALFSDIDVNKVTEDLNFKTEVDGVNITYLSRNVKVISNTGKVVRQDVDTSVDVKITLSYNENKYSDIVTFTVLKKDESPIVDETKVLENAFNALYDKDNLTMKLTSKGDNYNCEVLFELKNANEFKVTESYDDTEYSTTDYYYYFETDSEGNVIKAANDFDGEVSTDINEILDYFTSVYFFYFDMLLEANDEHFEKVDELTYKLKSEYISDVKKILGDLDYEDDSYKIHYEYLNFTVRLEKINNNYQIKNIEYDYNYTSNDTVSLYHDLMEFYNFGTTDFTWPESTPSPTIDGLSDLSKLYSLSSGSTVENIVAAVAGFSGNYVYLTDGNKNIVMYLNKGSSFIDSFNVGDVVSVSGTIDIYNNLYEIKPDETKLSVVDTYEIDYNEYSDVSNITSSNMGEVLNLNQVYFESLSVSTTKDTTLNLVDNFGNKISFFVKKGSADTFSQLVASFTEGDILNIQQVAVQVYKSNVQLVLTDQTMVGAGLKYEASKTKYNVDKGLELADVLADLVITNIKTKESYKFSDLEYETNYKKDEIGSYNVNFTIGEDTIIIIVNVIEKRYNPSVSFTTLNQLLDSNEKYYKTGLPSSGDVNVLVIPIKFTNSKNYDLSRIETAFNGTNEETGWYSLSGYYKETSYGKLNLHAEVLDPYNTGEKYDLSSGKSGDLDYKYFREAIAYYDDQIDYSLYDQNNDGYIDCVYLVYLAPYDGNTDLWWAYCYNYMVDNEEDDPKFDGVGLDYYLWFSYEFFDEKISSNIDVKINVETAIHESGHALGLDDYYDFDSIKGTTGGTGGMFMMDYNQGDHDPFSKALLGWINPSYVYEKDVNVTLKSFTDFGDALIISKSGTATYFDEYYIVALYTPTKENELKCQENCGLPSKSGLMILHIDQSLVDNLDDYHDCFTIFKYDNGTTDRKKIQFIPRESDEIYSNADYIVSDDDLFVAGDSFNFAWYDGTTSGTLNVKSLSSSSVELEIVY